MKKYRIRIETPRGSAWGTYNGIEGYHYTMLREQSKAFTPEEIEAHFKSDLKEGHYALEEE